MKVNLITKSNALCRSSWNPDSIWEARLIALVASKINKDDADFKTYEFTLNSLLGETNNSGKAYDILYSTAKKAMSRVVEIRNGKGWKMYNLFSKFEYNPDTTIFSIRFDPDLKPHYLNLKTKFTQYHLSHFMSLPSSYSQRMFEILKSWDDVLDVTIDISELHKMLKVPDSLRNFKDFRKRVLEKSHKDIHTYTDLKWEWEAIKKGRKVEKIRFIFSDRKISEKKVKAALNPKKRTKTTNRNAIFIEMAKCFEKRKDGCHRHKKKAVCELCDKTNR